MAPGSAARSRASLVAASAMPIIAEDDSVPPAVPKRSASRRAGKPIITPATVFNYNYMPNRSLPTAISSSSDGSSTVPDRKPEVNNDRYLEALRKQELVARRGGWYRLMIIAFLVIAAIVGLSVGLTLGLRKKKFVPLPSPFPFPFLRTIH